MLNHVPFEQSATDFDAPEMTAEYTGGQPVGGRYTEVQDLCDWTPMPQSADLDILPAKQLADGRSIDLTQNDGYAAGALQHHVDHVVGVHGLKLTLRPNWQILGLDEAWAKGFAGKFEMHWRAWVESPRNLVDVRGMASWPALQAVAWRTFITQGEVLAVFETRRGPRGKDMVSRIRLLDPERLSTPQKGSESLNPNIIGGVEFDAKGVPIAYYISNMHPRDLARRGMYKKMEWQRIEAVGKNGKRRVFHAMDPMRVDQTRGLSLLAPIIRAAKMIDKVSDAVLQAALMQTIFAAVVKSNADYEKIMQVIGGEMADGNGIKAVQAFMKHRANFYNRNRVNVKGAKAIHLLPDEDLELTTAKATNPDVGAFLDNFRQEIARGNGMSLEMYTGDYSKTNYSSSRMTQAEVDGGHRGRAQRVMVPFCNWVMLHFAEELFIRQPELLPPNLNFWDDQDHLCKSEWRIQPSTDADPEKTAKSAQMRLDAGTTTLEYECGLYGLNWEDVLEQRKREMETQKEMGLFEIQREAATAGQPIPDEKPETGGSSAADN